jgi:hypothetical protein
MLFAIFGLDFWTSFFIIFLLFGWVVKEMVKTAASSTTVQKGAAHWLLGLFK